MGFNRNAKAIDRLEDRLRALELKNDDLTRRVSAVNLEFIQLYDKVSHQMSRMAKRDARQKKENGENLPTSDAEESLDTVDPISRSILRRRGMGVPEG